MLMRNARVLFAAALVCSPAGGAMAQDEEQVTGLAHLAEEAAALRPLVETDLARRFLDAADDLTPV